MIDAKTFIRTILINNGALVALVPATRIFFSWPASFNTLPVIAFREINNFTDDNDIQDDLPDSENSNIQIDIFCLPNQSTTAIAKAVDTALTAAFYNRDYSEDMVEPGTQNIHKVMRYSAKLFV